MTFLTFLGQSERRKRLIGSLFGMVLQCMLLVHVNRIVWGYSLGWRDMSLSTLFGDRLTEYQKNSGSLRLTRNNKTLSKKSCFSTIHSVLALLSANNFT